ncbi:hypothetical protein GYMLUDRAFT_39449 [Collybiopsis luxurians FD-317 M1]|nr:hypothetical protein GYMLUDRAFT_39449 [Collybiopsis luxurians FD-317 M1]
MTSPIVIFDILQCLALISLLIPFTTAVLSKSVGRMRTWYNLLFFCIIYCVSFLLLVGHQSTKEEPPLGLCMFQAGAIYAAPPGVGVAGFVFNIELYWRLSSAIMGWRIKERNVSWLLFITPIVHVIIFWEAIFYGLSDLPSIERDPSGIYCHVKQKIPTLITGGTVIAFVVLSTTVEIYTAYFLWKRRRVFHEVRRRLSQDIFPFSLFIRVVLYTLIGFIAIIITIRLNVMPENTPEYIASMHTLSIIPLSVAVLFGSQKDILRVYAVRTKNATMDINEEFLKPNGVEYAKP